MKKKILLVGNYYPSYGGISALMTNLANNLNHEGYSTKIYSLGKNKGILRLLNYIRLPLIILKFDIIHAHGCSSFGQIPIIVSYFFSLLFKKYFIVTFHGSVNGSEKVAQNIFFKKIMSKSVIITTPTEITSDIFTKSGFKSLAIPNILEDNIWKYRKRKSIEPKLICTRSKYNPKLVIDTFLDVKKIYPNASLIMLGEFIDKKIKKYAISFDSITIIDNVPRSEVYKYLNVSDIYLNSCSNDSFGYSIFEALLSGLAVVSIESPSLLKIFGKDVILFSSDTTTLAGEVLYLLQNQECVNLRVDKGLEICHRYTWNGLKNKWLPLYDY